MITLRRMKPDDIRDGLRLCRQVKWNQLQRDWQLFLAPGPAVAIVAVEGENVVGTAATISYQQHFSWIGMVLVDAVSRRQGIGMRLLEEALYILRNAGTVKLDATPEGRAVYLRLNFVDEYSLSRMVLFAGKESPVNSNARVAGRDDLPALAAFDRDIFGADRGLLLQWMMEGAPQYAFMEEKHHAVEGYCMARKGSSFLHIGPVVANSLHTAKSLVTAALHKCIGQPVMLDATHFDPQWLQWLAGAGFKEQRAFTRMYRGSNLHPGIPAKQFAILGPEFG